MEILRDNPSFIVRGGTKLIKRFVNTKIHCKKIKEKNGITLPSLIITIIILLIITGITIIQLIGHGLIGKAKKTKEQSEKSQLEEEINLAIISITTSEFLKGNQVTLESLAGKEGETGQLEEYAELQGITAKLNGNEIVGEYKGYKYIISEQHNVIIMNKISNENPIVNISTQLMLTADNFIDISKNATKLNNYNSVTINKEIYKAGTGSFEFNGNNYLTFDSKNYILGTENFTIDLWIKSSNTVSNSGLIAQYPSDTKGSWALKIRDGKFLFTTFNVIQNRWSDTFSSTIITDGNWHHIAIVRNTDKIYLFVDGNKENTVTINQSAFFGTEISYEISIGRSIRDNANYTGLIDEIRISNKALWNDNFSVSDVEY